MICFGNNCSAHHQDQADLDTQQHRKANRIVRDLKLSDPLTAVPVVDCTVASSLTDYFIPQAIAVYLSVYTYILEF